jgi:hypothetical protein
MRQQAMDLLGRLTRSRKEKQDRFVELLRDAESESSQGWFMHVPKRFNAALDIRETERVERGVKRVVWTQGAMFSFKQGDLIYDTADGYLVWSAALQHIKICLSVTSAAEVTAPQQGAPRIPGSVGFDVFVPNQDRTAVVRAATGNLTQDGFVRLLISGEGLPQYP